MFTEINIFYIQKAKAGMCGRVIFKQIELGNNKLKNITFPRLFYE